MPQRHLICFLCKFPGLYEESAGFSLLAIKDIEVFENITHRELEGFINEIYFLQIDFNLRNDVCTREFVL